MRSDGESKSAYEPRHRYYGGIIDINMVSQTGIAMLWSFIGDTESTYMTYQIMRQNSQ